MKLTQLTPNLFVAPQIDEADLKALAREGFTDVVCNRPDAEHPYGPVSDILSVAAAAHGLTFHYQPITHGEPMDAQPDALAELVSRPKTKVLAYCRSGARSAKAWSLAASQSAPLRAAE